MSRFDILIKNGTVVDGTRLPKFKADVAIKDGRIAQIGGRLLEADAERVLDASGMIVAPGFVDLHTHYDAQIQWDPYCTISGWHGVTSVVLGNCGFGFAPVRPEERDRAMLTMSRTEAIPFDSMKAGMLWDWVTFPEWMDTLDRIPKGVNCLSYVPVSPLMIWAMGLEAAKNRPATEAEKKEMKRLLNEAMEAGACGFSLQRLGPNSAQADYDGTPMVTDMMAEDDIYALAEVLRDRDEGFVQINNSFSGNIKMDLEVQERIAEISGRPILHNLVGINNDNPRFHQRRLQWLQECNDRGLKMFGQAVTLRPGFAFTMEHWNLYDSSPAWNEATVGTYEEKMHKLADPGRRAAIRAETDAAIAEARRVNNVGGPIEDLVIQSVDQCANKDELEHYVGLSVKDLAAREGKDALDAMLDLSVRGGLRVEFVGQNPGYNAQYMAEMITSPFCVPGVSDGGAHTKFFTGGSYTTDFLAWLVRDEKVLSLEEAHYRLSYLPAHAAGFKDRGFLREGAPADIVVYNLDELKILPEDVEVGAVAYDFPAGEWRRIQTAEGYHWTIVNGEVTFENGNCTGATPGKLLRHGVATPG
ncbi:MAG: N-acyl-D-amino-acid deacylase family protein [Dehalococcoidia bacterium]